MDRRRIETARRWIALAMACGAMGAARAAEPLPIEAFAALPRVGSVVLSPDGKHFAAVMHQGAATLVVARDLEGDAPPTVLLRNDEPDFKVNWVRFVRDDRVVVSLAYANQRGWNELTETRLMAIDRDGGHQQLLVEPTRWQRNEMVAQFQDEVIDWLPEDGHHLLLAVQEDKRDPGRAVFKVDVDTGRRTLLRPAKSRVRRWLTDASHTLRVSVAQDGVDFTVQVADPDGSHWRDAWRWKLFDDASVWPLGFGADPNLLYVDALVDGRHAVRAVDLRDPALAQRPVLADARRDLVGHLVLDPATHRALGLSDGDAGTSNRFWDADTKTLVAAIDAALPGQANRLLQFSGDGSRYLVLSSGNGVPGHYLYGDRQGGKLTEIASQYPGLPPARLARKTALTVTARDGLPLPAFLTLPPGGGDRNLPTVLVPRGTPVGRDSLDFDPWIDFLTDRGYAVLQVNFRGSDGYGQGHLQAGLKRWGLEMQDDLSDALKVVVDRGIADPSRVCIVGAGFGGYAALMGGAKTPELYRCVAAFAGVSDLVDLGNDRKRFFNGKAVYESIVGSPWDDRAQLKETSPRHLAERFRAPVLLVHGTKDIAVPVEQSDEMAAALTSAGKPVKLVRQDGGDHQLSWAPYRLDFFRELEGFLATNLAPLPQTTAAVTPR